MTIRVFGNQFLDELTAKAASSPRRRQHFNLHSSYEDPSQRFFNALEPDTYIRPHRHDTSQGSETMVAIRGLMMLMVFDDSGGVTNVKRFGVDRLLEKSEVAVAVEVGAKTWHTVIALEQGSLLLEIKAGPFNPDSPKCPALWAPEESSDKAVAYLARLKNYVWG